ncbi:Protein kinase domain-containing protein [Rhizobium sp. RU20A]|uniref:protein kinase domain-containing protein n=1 Tax=Rhizobium sp. RU20A TaxID=1907412 RepID=UPI0009545AFC|nr:protein kinase [Rhizobium sp. RU20A]SIQ57613.1 Protein kinase domain-containing protein [Rhizobium sp. RU20A]
MGNAQHLTGKILKGHKTGIGWEVVESLNTPTAVKSTESNSHVYKVKDQASGRFAFLKAADVDFIGGEESLLVRLKALLMHHEFETCVSDHCHGNNMDRVCLAIDHGDAVIEANGVREAVFYLVFELADGDIRDQIFTAEQWTVQRKFRLLHQVAVGLSQLHSVKVSHNDLKPPNVLMYADDHKVSDLGQATREDLIAPHDWNAVVGDPRYAPPEALYSFDGDPGARLLPNRLRQCGDLYLLGSLMHFLFSGRMMTPCILERLHPVHLPSFEGEGWEGPYNDLIPFWREAMSEEFTALRKALAQRNDFDARSIDQIITFLSQLCDPDPELRGHPLDQVDGIRTFNLQRYISAFNVLSHRLQ